jgi:hypothetical protein
MSCLAPAFKAGEISNYELASFSFQFSLINSRINFRNAGETPALRFDEGVLIEPGRKAGSAGEFQVGRLQKKAGRLPVCGPAAVARARGQKPITPMQIAEQGAVSLDLLSVRVRLPAPGPTWN